MDNRRRFLKRTLAGCGALWMLLCSSRRRVGASRRILPKETPANALLEENPALLDIRHLEPSPVSDLATAGQTSQAVDLAAWRLKVSGAVRQPLELSHGDILAFPAVERRVLLICPGTFSFLADWKGVCLRELMLRAGMTREATQLEVRSAAGGSQRVEIFSLDEMQQGKLTLAYAVNRRPLPEEHGFPLRLVAEDRYGNVWVKYAESLTALE
jgi:sulfoxide reductase catalytic subunit YedY